MLPKYWIWKKQIKRSKKIKSLSALLPLQGNDKENNDDFWKCKYAHIGLHRWKMPPTTSWKRFAGEVKIGLGLGVLEVDFHKENFCLFALDRFIFTRWIFVFLPWTGWFSQGEWLSAADKHISEKSQNHCYWALQISAKGCSYIETWYDLHKIRY